MDREHSEVRLVLVERAPSRPWAGLEEPAAEHQQNRTDAYQETEGAMAVLQHPRQAVVFEEDADDFPRPAKTARIDHADAVARHAGAKEE